MTGPKSGTADQADGEDPTWWIDAVGSDPLRETSRQSRFALSNGFMGLRADRASLRSDGLTRRSSTAIAGLFDHADDPDAVAPRIPAPNWLRVHLSSSAGPSMRQPLCPADRMSLDLKHGQLVVESERCVGGISVLANEVRLVSAAVRSTGLQQLRLEVVEGVGPLTLAAGIGDVDSALTLDREEPDLVVWRDRRSPAGLAMAAHASLTVDGAVIAATPTTSLGWSWTWQAAAGQIVEFERLVAIGRSRVDVEASGVSAKLELEVAIRQGAVEGVRAHAAAWADRWSCSDIEIDGDPAAQKALRFAAFHLNGAVDPDDETISIGARGLTGDDYAGHVFWDTEIFLLPFYTLTWPRAARALLMYRFHTLEGAREKAKRLGWAGALYAWESAETGADVTPAHSIAPDRRVLDILCGAQEQHISADVAYAVWQYWTVTGDEAFMRDAGAEILLETARFWVSRAVPEADGLRHIRGVIGPDEYHETVDDNAFTNLMARWNIERGGETAELLNRRWPDRWGELSAGLDLTDEEIAGWAVAGKAIATGIDPRTGFIEQFEGFSGLEAIDLAAYAGRSVPMDVVLGRERTATAQVIKQADVVALIALLPDALPSGSAASNFAYYEPKCSHGSSLSTAMHGLVAARLGQTAKALDYYWRTSAIDLDETKAAIGGGVHMAALGGLWMMTVLGFAGVFFADDGIGLRPQLPTEWTGLRFPLQWRGRRLKVGIETVTCLISVHLETGDAMAIHFGAERYWLTPGQTVTIAMSSSALEERAAVSGPQIHPANQV